MVTALHSPIRSGLTRIVVRLGIASLAACGGGGGSDGGSDTDLSTNACSTIGLNTKIINGTPCDTAGSPIVEINIYDRRGSVYACSGTVVSDRYVLTAGHCFVSSQNSLDVESASINVRRGEIFASSITVPKRYREEEDAVFSDVAVLGFSRPLHLPTLPIIVSRKVSADEVIAIYGYGLDNDGNSGTLRSGEMLIDEVTPNHLIAKFGFTGSNTCFGDSGGPAVIQFTDNAGSTVTGVVGVTSSGDSETCATGDRSLFSNLQEEPVLGFLQRAIPGLQLK